MTGIGGPGARTRPEASVVTAFGSVAGGLLHDVLGNRWPEASVPTAAAGCGRTNGRH